MTNEEYMADVARTRRPITQESRLIEAALGLTSEAGEVADLILKARWAQRGHSPSHLIAEELGDVLFYLAEMADCTGFSLTEIMELNVAKRQKRYPNGWNLVGSYHD